MIVTDLITDRTLSLLLATPSTPDQLARRVGAAVMTESISPEAYLEPDTLLATTGMALNFADARIWEGYVERLVRARVCAVAFGVGSAHPRVPAGLTTAAQRAGLPVLEVPAEVPFLRLQQTITRALAEERFRLSGRAWQLADACTRIAGASAGPQGMVERIAQETGAPAAIIDDLGRPFAHSGAAGPGGQQPPAAEARAGSAGVDLPLVLGTAGTWGLRLAATGAVDDDALRTLVSPAAGVLSMALAHELAAAGADDTPLARALAAPHEVQEQELRGLLIAAGVGPGAGIRAVTVRSSAPLRARLLGRRIEGILAASGPTAFVALPHTTVLLCRPGEKGIEAAALERAVSAAAGDRVSVGEPARSAGGVLLSVRLLAAEAALPTAVQRSGVHFAGPPELADIVGLIPPILRTALPAAVCAPIMDSPESGRLREALGVIAAAGSNEQAARALGIHRNTLRPLRARLERLLGVDLSDPRQRAVAALIGEIDGGR